MHAGKPAQLRDLGYDEIWLQNWLAADPARLGLGEVQIVAQELSAPRGGSLDILARYYSPALLRESLLILQAEVR
jgi:hypothetical protein